MSDANEQQPRGGIEAGKATAAQVVQAHCNECGGTRNSFVRAEHVKH